jgi:predicted nucleotidyltransferase/DNA-binding XRE family transcriptional regulator
MKDVTYAEHLKLRRSAAGLTQRELAAASGVKQPLIAALETGTRQPTDPAREALERALGVRPSQVLGMARERVLDVVHAIGGTDVRIFGSVARGTDKPDSDIDLLVTFPPGSDIVTLLTLQEDLSNLLTVPVDVVSAGSTGPVLERALTEAVPL